MNRQLMILEVSQKQAYIFAPRELAENIRRSEEIARVTSSDFFEKICREEYSKGDNLVYSGGGHAVLQFPDKAAADRFARKLSLHVLKAYSGMELFISQRPYDPDKNPGDNLNDLARALEEKKALRVSSLGVKDLGFDLRPNVKDQEREEQPGPHGWKVTTNTDKLAGEDNFLAVIHIDGNSMGKRVQAIYDKCQDNWEECVKMLQLFSDDIDLHFRQAYNEMEEELMVSLWNNQWPGEYLPLRRLIGAGDDVCFITAGKVALDCAASFLEHLSKKRNSADGAYYSACAGVALIHKKFPFRRAYELSEALCSNAKKVSREWGSGISAMDYHIEFGQMKPTLSQIRRDYRTEDGGYLELRPLAVTWENEKQILPARKYEFLRVLLTEIGGKTNTLARSKLKALRTAFHQGRVEAQLAMRMTQTEELLYRGIETLFPNIHQRTLAGENVEKSAFYRDEKNRNRCLFFDAIEFSDNTLLWRPAGKEEGK